MAAIQKMIKHPDTGKRMNRVYVNGKGWFTWNTAYHVYNSTANYDQLQESEVDKIDFTKERENRSSAA